MRRIDPRLINMMLLGYGSSTRRLLELPILADVWAAFAQDPASRHRLLMTSTHNSDAGELASALADAGKEGAGGAEIAAIQGFVAARLTLNQVLVELLPRTHWWSNFELDSDEEEEFGTKDTMRDARRDRSSWRDEASVDAIHRSLLRIRLFEEGTQPKEEGMPPRRRARQMVGLAQVMGTLNALRKAEGERAVPPIASFEELDEAIGFKRIAEAGHEAILRLGNEAPADPAMIWIVTTNRRVDYATLDSIQTIKADAARELFSVDCSKVSWAVLDSGIDHDHPAFQAADGTSRVTAIYDFGRITRILDRRNCRDRAFCTETARLLDPHPMPIEERTERICEAVADWSRAPRTSDWERLEPLLKCATPPRPSDPHGTHVAGILGGRWETTRPDGTRKLRVNGVCPDINLVDIRVLGETREQTEFAVICALQFVRHLNSRGARSVIDGVNLSLSIPHDVLSYACGKTPVCLEAENLVSDGTVVVAAAGNHGYQDFRLATGSVYSGYAVASITDPGNAENVITVGSTHRFAPHTYGVSYFSSRGPTGDGRAKPDILAPGERITSAVPDRATDTLDGTSMAAPHVSGAAAILIARHRELRGQPAAIKQILCETATDVGRIGVFQGSGLLDILRALQHNWRTTL